MKQLRLWLVLLASLTWAQLTRAQVSPALYAHASHGCHCHCHCCCGHDTTTITEHNNRTAFSLGVAVPVDGNGLAHVGGFIEVGRAIGPRLTAGGYLMASSNRASASNYGFEATAPAYSLHELTGTLRYQLLNSRRWRVDALGGLGVGAVQLVDRDQQVYGQGKYGTTHYAATVAFRVHPLAEVGLGTSYKVARDFWLSSRVSYTSLALNSGLGTPGEFSYWAVSLGATMPWGWR